MKSANSKCTYTWKKSSHSSKSLVFGWLLCSREVMCLQQHTCESRFFWHSYLSSFPSEIWQFPRLLGLFESGAAAWTLCVAGSSKWRCWTLLVFWTLRQWQLGESLEGQGSTERCDRVTSILRQYVLLPRHDQFHVRLGLGVAVAASAFAVGRCRFLEYNGEQYQGKAPDLADGMKFLCDAKDAEKKMC